MARVVLVTGVSRHLGGSFARMLQHDPRVDRVIGVDVVDPSLDLGGAEFIRSDLRHPRIAKVLATHEVDTVVHMGVIATPLSAGGRTSMKEINVIGTMQLLAACQRASSVRSLVVKSSTSVYGSSPHDPAMFTETMEPREHPKAGFAKDSVEVEGYVRGLARRRPDIAVTMLRFASCLGPTVTTPLSTYFSLPVWPTRWGFDGRLQFVHEADLLTAVLLATVEEHPGTFNIAGAGTLLLSQCARLAGRVTLPLPGPGVEWAGDLTRRTQLVDFSPETLQYLSYGRGVDTSAADAWFTPEWSTRETFTEFVRARGLTGWLTPDRVGSLEQSLLAALTSAPMPAMGAAAPAVGGDRE